MESQIWMETMDGFITALSLGGIASFVTIPWTGLAGVIAYFVCGATLVFLIWILPGL